MSVHSYDNSKSIRPFVSLSPLMLAGLVGLAGCVDADLEDELSESSETQDNVAPQSDTAYAYAFLTRFGYFPNPELAEHYPGWRPLLEGAEPDSQAFEAELGQALELYQEASGLPVTGTLDATTWDLMHQPRCAVPDYYGLTLAPQHQPGGPEASGQGQIEGEAFALWDQPWPYTEFSYGFGQATGNTSAQAQRQAIVAAIDTWTAVAPIAFAERPNPDMLLSFFPRAHGDGNDFLPTTYAHAFLVGGCQAFRCWPLSGDVHFNDQDYDWDVDGMTEDIQSIALHELGHALGLRHSADASAIMFATKPQGQIKRQLSQDDINGIQTLYPIYRDPRTFDVSWYLQLNPDLAGIFGGNTNAASYHWRNHGRHEGRPSSPVFDVRYYLAIHPDLTNAFGANGYAAAYWHWRDAGLYEGRRSSPAFDTSYYLAHHPDLVGAFGATGYDHALLHWMNYGLVEGRRASVEFDPAYYLQVNADIANFCGAANNYACGLRHWLQYGRAENRVAAP